MLKARQKLGKYRIERQLAEGNFAMVYRAFDTIEGIPVALKIPHRDLVTEQTLELFRKEVRLTAKLDHPNILPLKNASFIDRDLVIVFPLGDGTLADRLRHRLSTRIGLDIAEQTLDALAFAHSHRVIHCDVKPANIIMFRGNRVRLTDFGIAKIALRTRAITGSGTGTVGYLAPEQAMGKPSLRSDVFAAGLLLYRMFSGRLPEWPYEWPLPGFDRLRERVSPDFIRFLQRAMEVSESRRYKDAIQMRAAFERVKKRAERRNARRRRRTSAPSRIDWKTVRLKEFTRRHGKSLEALSHCDKCKGPIGQAMQHCPWCGSRRRVYRGRLTFPERCRRCGRGMKSDWRFCAWCYGPGVDPVTSREYTDTRYVAKCRNPSCRRKDLMPFMRYCPWCRTKVTRAWKVDESRDKCQRCGWGVLGEFWSYCPWCGLRQKR